MVRVFLFLAGLACALAHAATPPAPRVMGKAWIVGDITSGQVLLAEKADERIEPASLTKLMTAYIVFGALHDKKLNAVSESANRRARHGGYDYKEEGGFPSTGLIIAGIGLLLWSGFGKDWLGRLPGDIHYTKGNFSFHFPIVTCLLISAFLTILLWLFRK